MGYPSGQVARGSELPPPMERSQREDVTGFPNPVGAVEQSSLPLLEQAHANPLEPQGILHDPWSQAVLANQHSNPLAPDERLPTVQERAANPEIQTSEADRIDPWSQGILSPSASENVARNESESNERGDQFAANENAMRDESEVRTVEGPTVEGRQQTNIQLPSADPRTSARAERVFDTVQKEARDRMTTEQRAEADKYAVHPPTAADKVALATGQMSPIEFAAKISGYSTTVIQGAMSAPFGIGTRTTQGIQALTANVAEMQRAMSAGNQTASSSAAATAARMADMATRPEEGQAQTPPAGTPTEGDAAEAAHANSGIFEGGTPPSIPGAGTYAVPGFLGN